MSTRPSGPRHARILFISTFALGASSAHAQVHVDANNPAPNPGGTSWSDAYGSLQDALANLGGQTEVWVADGLYPVGPSGSPRTSTFDVPQGVFVYGGFMGDPGGETTLAMRAGLFDQTILTGDIEGDSPAGNLADDAYHVVRFGTNIPSDNAILDGFTIEYGNADGPGTDSDGGGIFIPFFNGGTNDIELNNLTVRDCRAADEGGGIHAVRLGDSTAKFVSLERNLGLTRGGGLYLLDAGDNYFFNFSFTGNRSALGGGMFVDQGNAINVFVNSQWHSNNAAAGGGIFLDTVTPTTLISCTVAYNFTSSPSGASPAGGAGVFSQNTGLKTIENSILYFNRARTGGLNAWSSLAGPNLGATVTARYSDVQFAAMPLPGTPLPPWFDAASSIFTDPRFRNGAARDLTLLATSPCLDAADDNVLPDDLADLDGDGTAMGQTVPFDLIAGNAREVNSGGGPGMDGGGVAGAISDMGAYERQ